VHDQRNPITVPTGAELRSVSALLGDAQAQLESIAWSLSPIHERGEQGALTFEELGRLASFVSSASSDVDSMSKLVEQLARVRDAASPGLG
jgi:hypothetical protein